ncbi:type I 3-dehydroquinate dehydratase [Aminipila butyrica]|uniref:3-dehydroquinate dehydratase n=1 Tax=Aminipila butyrica TaxID=433296 RepID=A0A858BSF7_9FIRM|nr:type I 3-dehydroquinate dehydratase [Aminipila butyrica]QIB68045.1 type I 3-dehydroquinate dehydratase [Aminipila butyrica]
MKTLEIRNLTLGAGRPKICAPIVGKTKAEILEEAKAIYKLPADMAEWRVDFLQPITEDRLDQQLESYLDQVLNILAALRACLQDKPLLFTFRTTAEGGENALSPENYTRLNQAAAASTFADLLDVEVSVGKTWATQIIQEAHSHGTAVVGSSHHFQRTPPKGEMISLLRNMQALGVDISKIAVMPSSIQDVLTLLETTAEMQTNGGGPIITMAMSSLGGISRLAGEYFGSAVTFGSVSNSSAPGQIPVEDLNTILNIIHSNLHLDKK